MSICICSANTKRRRGPPPARYPTFLPFHLSTDNFSCRIIPTAPSILDCSGHSSLIFAHHSIPARARSHTQHGIKETDIGRCKDQSCNQSQNRCQSHRSKVTKRKSVSNPKPPRPKTSKIAHGTTNQVPVQRSTDQGQVNKKLCASININGTEVVRTTLPAKLLKLFELPDVGQNKIVTTNCMVTVPNREKVFRGGGGIDVVSMRRVGPNLDFGRITSE